MKIGMVFYDLQEFGGLEEYAVGLASALQDSNHSVSVFCCEWIAPENQYMLRLRERDIPVVQPPRWVSLPASDWSTKEKMVAFLGKVCIPLAVMLGIGLASVKKMPIAEAVHKARNWLRGQLGRVIHPDRRKVITEWMLAAWCWLWKPDILHLQGFTTNLLYVIDWAYQRGFPVVYEEHATPDPMFAWWQDSHDCLNKATMVIAVSEKSGRGLREVCQVTRPIRIKSQLVSGPNHSGEIAEPGLEKSQPHVVTSLARLHETKGLKHMLDMVVLVSKRYPDTVFKVYGNGPLQDKLMRYAEEIGLEGSAIFVGAVDHSELPRIMNQTDIFLLTSILEGQPLAIIEAMAYGRPIVATSVGGIPELIQDGANGLLCPPGDPASLAEKVIALIEQPELRRQLGKAARRSYEQGPFQPEAVSQELLAIYAEAIEINKEK